MLSLCLWNFVRPETVTVVHPSETLPICHFGQEGQADIIHKRTEIKCYARNEFTHRNFTLIMLEFVTVGSKLF